MKKGNGGKNESPWINSFSMILGITMILSIVSYGIKNIIFNEKNVQLAENNYFNNVFCNRTFSYCPILKKCFNHDKSWLILSGKY